MSSASPEANAEQIAYWNQQTGPHWVALEARLDALIEPLGLAAMDRAGIRRGERVLDVGCGCGQTLLQLAERVGPEGRVTGLDVSTVMLARARERVSAARLSQVEIENADAQTAPLATRAVDLVFSRFGVMFFADPVAAFGNLRRALAPGGRLAFVCWQGIDRNPWMLVPLQAAARHVALPAPPPPGAPGPFSLADPDRLESILAGAGFEDVALEPLELDLVVGGEGPLRQAVEFLMGMGPTGAALRAAPDADRAAVEESIREVLAPYVREGAVRMPSASWIATAVRPAVRRV